MGASRKVVGGIVVSLILIGVGVWIALYMFSTVDLGQVEQYVFQYINEERAARNLRTLGNDTDLCSVAKNWSSYISSMNNLTHGDFDGRMQNIGLPNTVYSCGEIIGSFSSGSVNFIPTENSASDIARELVNGWLNSPLHREIMLTDSNGYMGVGVGRYSGVFYGVIDFKFG